MRFRFRSQPLTTALSSREYIASGIFVGSLIGPEQPRGDLEVGYEIGCGIDMSTSNGVDLGGNMGMRPVCPVSRDRRFAAYSADNHRT